ncbi:hypothetical protein [Alteromonas mediterranea]|nr:hypothetical protein [Alteromonas mediterranea]
MIDILPLELCGPNGFGASKEHLFILNTTKDSGERKWKKKTS